MADEIVATSAVTDQYINQVADPAIRMALRVISDRIVDSATAVEHYSGTGAPTNGTSGTGVGLAGPGSTYTDVSNGQIYVNTNTLASPTWSVVAPIGITASAAELNYNDITTLGTGAASKAVVLDAGGDFTWPATGILTYGVLKDPAGTTLGSTVAELNLVDGTTAGTVVASKALAVDAQKAVDTLRATTDLNVGGTGVPGAAKVETTITKAVTAFTDTTAKDVFTVTVPNAAHAAVIEIDALGVLGAGGSIGAGESSRNVTYQVALARTAGVAVVPALSSAIGGASAVVAGGQAITSVVATLSAITGAVGATQTFTILFAITRSGAGADNHTLVASARVLNQNASGVTIA